VAKIIIAFVLLLVVYAVGIKAFRSMTNKERLSSIKTLGYASVCAFLSAVTLAIIVYTF
jgi:Tfp pilus assembly protein PilX